MRIVSKVVSGILFCSIFLVSCGGVTPVPTVMPTSMATVTQQTVLTSTPETPIEEQPELSTQIWKHLPPSQFVDQYKLAQWSPKYYETVNDLLNNLDAKYYGYMRQQLNDFHAAFASEAWLRTSFKMDNNSLLCDARYYNPGMEYFPELRTGQDLLSFFVEDLLNNEGVTVDGLPEKFRDLFGRPECLFGFSLDVAGNVYFEPVFVQNLFGDGQEAYVFAVGTLSSDNRVAIYAAHSVDGVYRVEKMRDWEEYVSLMSGTSIKFVDTGDLNNNGRSEIVIQVDFGSSGFPPRESEWLYRYEWDPIPNLFLGGQKITIFAQECYVGACYGTWEFKHTGSQGNLILTTDEYFNTGVDACEHLIREKDYLSVNGTYSLKSDTLLAPENNFSACQISWAYEILIAPNGWKNDKAIGIISNAINDWPAEMNSAWGVHSREYFQLMLGVWRDFRGENEQSVTLFESLVLLQDSTESSFIGQLAKAYLSVRQQKGMVVACSQMNTLQEELLSEKYGQEATQFIGFGGNRWPTSVNRFCDDNAALESLFSRNDASNIDSQEALNQWLVDQGKTDIYIQNVIMGDKELWLASFLTRTTQKYDANIYQSWAFFTGPNGQNAVLLGNSKITEWNKENAVVFTSKQEPPILLVEIDDCLLFLSITSGEVKILKNICGIDLFFSKDNERVNVMLSDWYPGNWRFVSYTWDNAAQSLRETASQSYDFDSVQRKAETLIYKENDYIGAIVYISNVLLMSPPDQVFWPDCYDYIAERANDIEAYPNVTLCEQPMEWHRPYLLYLLGMSYEMSGQLDNAKATYYSLWHDYPNNIFGVAASLKLEPVNP